MNKEVVEQQDNVVTTKDKYNRVIKRSIILCWIALAICFIVKIFGGNFFEIATTNQQFIKLCNFIDNNCLRLVQFINYYLISIIYFSATYRVIRLKLKDFLILSGSIVALFILKVINIYIGSAAELVVMLLYPIIFAKEKWWKPIIYLLLYYVFGYVSLFIKTVGCANVPNCTLIGLIFSIDVYFMLLLFVLYNYKKEN